jgi:formylglycine-generating enzyme required for sulfatase activity
MERSFGALPYPDNNQDELPVVQVTWKEATDFCNIFRFRKPSKML